MVMVDQLCAYMIASRRKSPAEGSVKFSKTDAFDGTRRNPIVFDRVPENGPACVAFHSARSSAATVALRLITSKVVVELTVK